MSDNSVTRPSGRKFNELREVKIIKGISKKAEGSAHVIFGGTEVRITASVEEKVPAWLKGQNKGWVTAEYSMLPRSTHDRIRREVSQGKPSGRTQEIQRLIGRSLRSVVDLEALGERQIIIDCDVIEADGGTRTASITGGFVALYDALLTIQKNGAAFAKWPIKDYVAAISCGIYQDCPVLDLDYAEDSTAEVDANFIMTGSGQMVEIQSTGEERPYSLEEFNQLLQLADDGIKQLVELQKAAIEG